MPPPTMLARYPSAWTSAPKGGAPRFQFPTQPFVFVHEFSVSKYACRFSLEPVDWGYPGFYPQHFECKSIMEECTFSFVSASNLVNGANGEVEIVLVLYIDSWY
jgi:hypothetical protein